MGEVKQKRRVATAPGVRQAPRPRDCLFMPPPVQWFRSTFRLPVALYRRWPGKLHRTGNARNGGSSSALVAIRREAARPATGPPSKRGPAVASPSPTPAPGPIAAFLEQQILLARLELGLARRSRTPTRSPPHPTAPSRQSREGTSPAVEQRGAAVHPGRPQVQRRLSHWLMLVTGSLRRPDTGCGEVSARVNAPASALGKSRRRPRSHASGT